MSTRAQARAPLAVAAVAFAAGVWLAHVLLRSPGQWGWATALLAFCAIAAVFGGSLRTAQTAAAFALIGAGAFARTATPTPSGTVPPSAFLNGEAVEITAHVVSDGALLATGGPRNRFDLMTESIQYAGDTFTQPVGIRVTVYSRDMDEDNPDIPLAGLPHLSYGDRLHLTGKLRSPRNFRNPGAFDYVGYMRGLGITVQASARAEDIETLPGFMGSRAGLWHSRIRQSIIQHIHGSGLWTRDDAALFAAMIIGDDSRLLRDVREEFQKTGVYHLLVVSGMNVALLAVAIFWAARRLRLPEWGAALVTITLSCFYACVAGLGVPIVRAVLMLSLFLFARLLYRDRSALNATGFAALMVLVFSPSALFEAGFQLTFLALAAITGIALPIVQRTASPYRQALKHLASTGYDLGLPPNLAQFRLDLRLIAGRMAPYLGTRAASRMVAFVTGIMLSLYELVIVSAITQAALVLPMRAYFHRAAIIGLPANILVLPLAGIMLNSGIVAIALSYVSMPLARVAAWVAAGALHWILHCLNTLAHLPVAQWRVPDPGLALGLIAATGVLLALIGVRRQRRLALAGIVCLFASAGTVAWYHAPPKWNPGKLEITAIDVGQGDALLVVSPEGQTMLIDGGGSVGRVHSEFDFGEDVVAPYLWSRGLTHLDRVVLTHAHGDHIGGLPQVVQNFHPQELWVGINPETPLVQQLYNIAALNHTTVRKHTSGEELDWGGTKIRVLSPPPDWRPKAEPKNDDSLSLLITYRETGALLAGDLEKKMERYIATESPRADLLKIAHHGSATSTTPELLAAVRPRFSVISAGYHNAFGHPRHEVLARLQAARVKTYRTDMFGLVTFLLDGKNVEAFVGLHLD